MFAFEEPSHLPSLDGSTLEASWTGISGRYQCPNSVHQCEWKDVQRCLAYPCLCFCQVVATAGRCGNLCDSDFRQWFLSLPGTIFAGKLRISLWERRRREGASLSLSVFPCSPVAATSFWSLLVTSSQANLWYHLAGPPGAVPKKVLILGGKTCYSYTDIVQCTIFEDGERATILYPTSISNTYLGKVVRSQNICSNIMLIWDCF